MDYLAPGEANSFRILCSVTHLRAQGQGREGAHPVTPSCEVYRRKDWACSSVGVSVLCCGPSSLIPPSLVSAGKASQFFTQSPLQRDGRPLLRACLDGGGVEGRAGISVPFASHLAALLAQHQHCWLGSLGVAGSGLS